MKETFKKNGKNIWGLALVVVWIGLIGILLHHFGVPTVEGIVNYQPENQFAAVAVMLGLFLLKSMDFIMYSGILYAASGIMFPLVPALLLNLVGVGIMVTVPYFVGKAVGGPFVDQLREKYPKIQEISSFQNNGEFMIAVLMRALGVPLLAAGLYMGAMNFRYDRYLPGSILGIAPEMVAFTVMGMSAADSSSPAFLLAVGVKIFVSAAAVVSYSVMKKKNAANSEKEGSPS